MIAKIKITANLKDIEEAQKEYQKIIQENAEGQDDLNFPLLELPSIPEQILADSDICLSDSDISLAFVNSNGEISIKYKGDNFNLVYTDFTWDTIKSLSQFK